MLGNHTGIIIWKVGDRVFFDRDYTGHPGTVVKVDDPPFTVEVVWDDDPEPQVMWANRLVRYETLG